MADPLHELGDVEPALELALAEARRYLATLEDGLVQPAGAAERVAGIGGPLPEHGDGALAAIRELSELGNDAATRSSGPRFFHLVTGGATPAALAADWLASSFDQSPSIWEGTAAGVTARDGQPRLAARAVRAAG